MPNNQLQDLPESTSRASSWSNVANLSRKIRELSHRWDHAPRAKTQPDALAQAGPDEMAVDLQYLGDQVARLQRKIHDRWLKPLIL